MPRLPTAVLATGLMLLAFLSLMAGLILDTVTRGRWEQKRMAYLAIQVPRTLRRRIPGTALRFSILRFAVIGFLGLPVDAGVLWLMTHPAGRSLFRPGRVMVLRGDFYLDRQSLFTFRERRAHGAIAIGREWLRFLAANAILRLGATSASSPSGLTLSQPPRPSPAALWPPPRYASRAPSPSRQIHPQPAGLSQYHRLALHLRPHLGGGALRKLAEGSFIAKRSAQLVCVQFGNEPDLFKHTTKTTNPGPATNTSAAR